ncbi:quaternary amine ABC transporter ATP-binding protein [Paracoccus fistulariae]|uniref:Quaternary amine transport ATP-binding protein n=1 Tax=Paracoccus fistulariae TaxID=658446 RepID=A0ABY7SPH5_9RHOB|nr:glycine betaine/L-proline ABC transporter ATP-binding protein [Paracoccus fistulariae]MDB6180358.1 glycine betaine/L-proline ABC transporter ATP-binding protein [Paracoccus fistulariae]WCR08438.1 glycine betaine/L-proline ABC transporter ATP-binding protein [Paracoccus fistulariae]
MAEAIHDIDIRGLYKIFGPNGAAHVADVKAGMTKDELKEKYDHVLGLDDINLTIPAGRIQVVMGLSGSGKSTLIRHINRLIEPTVGEIMFDGQDVVRMSQQQLRDFRRQKTAMVFQKFALFPHRTVMENTTYGLNIRGVSSNQAKERARYWIERVGLKGFEESYPNQLSGGMQQRVGLARALTNDAEILLMDEAFSALDPLIRMDMQSVLLDLQEELRKTIIFITHDLDEALRLGDRIAILRAGRIVQEGTGEQIVLRPKDDYIADFVREVSRGKVLKVGTITRRGVTVESPVTLPADVILEEAARTMTNAEYGRANVADASGKVIGSVTLAKVVAEMIAPDDSDDSLSQTDQALSA